MPGRDTEDTEDLLRTLAPQVLGAVVRRYGHFSVAEDAVQEALLAAAVQWPDAGVPGNPQGWLITVAARRLTDLLRAEQTRSSCCSCAVIPPCRRPRRSRSPCARSAA